MAPVGQGDLTAVVKEYINKNKILIFSKSTCPFCDKVKSLFNQLNIQYYAVELNQLDNGADLQAALAEVSGQRTVPNVYINGQHLGGSDDTFKAHSENRLLPMVTGEMAEEYDYDLIVIGGGSGGLAAAKEAAAMGRKVCCMDFVKPSPQGTTWGLGGTCVNVGCIPKKLMHQAAILGHELDDAKLFGWDVKEEKTHTWSNMKDAIQDYIGSLNWGYRVQLRQKEVDYQNAFAEFIGPHKVKATNKRGKVIEKTSRYFILAMGGRPFYPDVPGLKEYAISSDDLFSLPYAPGKTIVMGASYVSLECAGFLAALKYDVTVMVRSILLRGFDQQMAEKIGDYMKEEGIKFIRPAIPTKVERLEEGTPGLYRVTMKLSDGTEKTEDYNTVMVAVGRTPCTQGMGLENVGVNLNKSGFVIANEYEQTSCPNIYAVGDILEGKPELTPTAIQAGKLLSRRLFGEGTLKMDYVNVPTTVFTPLEYGCIGLSEEDAIAKYGENDIEVYHSNYQPLEWTVAKRDENTCYAKLVCVISEKERVVGLHVLGPNAGEITQGFTLGLKLGATKADFDNAVGIHPTNAEIFTTLNVTKRSGGDVKKTGC